MGKKNKKSDIDDLLNDPLDKVAPEVLRSQVNDGIYNFHAKQFIMENVCVPDIDDDDNLCTEPFCETQHTENKGRILVAKMDFNPGDLILREKSFINGSWSEYHCLECLKPHKPTKCPIFKCKYPLTLRNHIDQIEEILAEEEIIGELDRARLFIKCMYMMLTTPDAPAWKEFLILTPANEPECIAAIDRIRKRKVIEASGLLPPSVTTEAAARVLSILNCNSHEIEHIGSGLFLRASMMEHDCVPNCNFVTERDEINVVCIRSIRAGEPMSIDYSHAPYQPTAVRQQQHQEAYGFMCTCAMCTTEPDRARAFHCPQGVRNAMAGKTASDGAATPDTCHGGLVCPRGLGHAAADWRCLSCNYTLTEQEIQVCLDAEKRYPPPPESEGDDEEAEAQAYELAGMTPRTADDIGKMLGENILHEAHHTVFWSMMALAFKLTRDASNVPVAHVGKGRHNKKQKAAAGKGLSQRQELCAKAEMVWTRIIGAAETGLPRLHPDKVNYLDHLAQVKVLAKDIVGAKELWRRAFEMSRIINGAHTANTRQLEKLYRNTPRTVEALQFHYQNMHEALDRVTYEEDKESAKLLNMLAASTLDQEDEEKKNTPEVQDESDDDEEEDEEEDIFKEQRNKFANVEAYMLQQGLIAQPIQPPADVPQPQSVASPQEASAPQSASSADVKLTFSNAAPPSSVPFSFASSSQPK